jgi:hypothetical protein
MSDLQILAGLSILISGYSQLRCGLSVCHWQILVYLTWFCSLTHLSCLTFLRNHLYNHRGERLWRLIGMGALIVMLIAAPLPTGKYGTQHSPAEYAICTFGDLSPGHYEGSDIYIRRRSCHFQLCVHDHLCSTNGARFPFEGCKTSSGPVHWCVDCFAKVPE